MNACETAFVPPLLPQQNAKKCDAMTFDPRSASLTSDQQEALNDATKLLRAQKENLEPSVAEAILQSLAESKRNNEMLQNKMGKLVSYLGNVMEVDQGEDIDEESQEENLEENEISPEVGDQGELEDKLPSITELFQVPTAFDPVYSDHMYCISGRCESRKSLAPAEEEGRS